MVGFDEISKVNAKLFLFHSYSLYSLAETESDNLEAR